jgi:hypothetical protein
MIAHAEFIDGDELIAAFQPRPQVDGQGDFLITGDLREDDRAFTGAGL